MPQLAARRLAVPMELAQTVCRESVLKPRRTLEELRRARERLQHTFEAQQERRRAEDLIREELRDSRAKTIRGPHVA
jgi:hypothetical protein